MNGLNKYDILILKLLELKQREEALMNNCYNDPFALHILRTIDNNIIIIDDNLKDLINKSYINR